MKKFLTFTTFNLGVEAWCINFSILRDETLCMSLSTFTPILKAVLPLFAARAVWAKKKALCILNVSRLNN